MSAKLVPATDKLVVRRSDPVAKSKGGILLPEQAREKPRKGEVLAVGPASKERPFTIKPGALVLFSAYSGTEVDIDDEKLLVLNHEDILGTVE